MIQDTLVVVEDPCFKREMTSLVQRKSVGMEVIAEAAGSVDEIRFLDTGQVGHNVMVEDHCFHREVVGLVQKESTVMGIVAESSLVSVSEYSMPTKTVEMSEEQFEKILSANSAMVVPDNIAVAVNEETVGGIEYE